VHSFGREANRVVPGRRNQPAAFLIANQGSADSLFMIDERMTETAFDAEELAIVAVNITITRYDSHHFGSAPAERHLTTVRAISAGRNGLRQFPRAMLVPVGAVKQRSRRTNLDAIAALGTVKPAAERADDCISAAITRFNCFFTHPLVAHACAAFAKN